MKAQSDIANNILDDYGINPNEAANGMYLPNKFAKSADFNESEYGPLHSPLDHGDHGLHRLDYVTAVANRLKSVKDNGIAQSLPDEEIAARLRDELQRIAVDIVDGSFPGVTAQN